jgi:hypothetical protein
VAEKRVRRSLVRGSEIPRESDFAAAMGESLWGALAATFGAVSSEDARLRLRRSIKNYKQLCFYFREELLKWRL